MNKFLIAFVLFVIILIIYTLSTWNVSTNEDYLYGFWTAEDDEFCEESGIDAMLLFIGEPTTGWSSTTRQCYLVIMSDKCNTGLCITYSPSWSGPSITKYRIHAKAEFDNNEELWPEDITIDVDMRNGTMLIHSGDTTYARLTKQHDTTNSCRYMDKCTVDEMVGSL